MLSVSCGPSIRATHSGKSARGQAKDGVAKVGKMRVLRSVGFLLLLFVLLAVPIKSFAQFSLRITVAPPELVVYAQPVCPQEGYIWTPGYWAYGEEGYFWVPGTWVEPPTVGYLWTPGYWGWGDGVYAWNDGYWGSEVGFYGGVNYGFGYGGSGYDGGYWRGGQFSYNTYVNNVGRGGNRSNGGPGQERDEGVVAYASGDDEVGRFRGHGGDAVETATGQGEAAAGDTGVDQAGRELGAPGGVSDGDSGGEWEVVRTARRDP